MDNDLRAFLYMFLAFVGLICLAVFVDAYVKIQVAERYATAAERIGADPGAVKDLLQEFNK